MYNEIIEYIENSLSKYLFGFRKGHSTEQCLTIMLEAWKKALDEKKYAGGTLPLDIECHGVPLRDWVGGSKILTANCR